MKRKLFFLYFLFLIVGPSFLQAQTSFKSEWTACSQASDCMWLESYCDMPAASNEKYLKEYKYYLDQKSKVVKCRALWHCIDKKQIENFHAMSRKHVTCADQKCVIRIPQKVLLSEEYKEEEIACLKGLSLVDG